MQAVELQTDLLNSQPMHTQTYIHTTQDSSMQTPVATDYEMLSLRLQENEDENSFVKEQKPSQTATPNNTPLGVN